MVAVATVVMVVVMEVAGVMAVVVVLRLALGDDWWCSGDHVPHLSSKEECRSVNHIEFSTSEGGTRGSEGYCPRVRSPGAGRCPLGTERISSLRFRLDPVFGLEREYHVRFI